MIWNIYLIPCIAISSHTECKHFESLEIDKKLKNINISGNHRGKGMGQKTRPKLNSSNKYNKNI